MATSDLKASVDKASTRPTLREDGGVVIRPGVIATLHVCVLFGRGIYPAPPPSLSLHASGHLTQVTACGRTGQDCTGERARQGQRCTATRANRGARGSPAAAAAASRVRPRGSVVAAAAPHAPALRPQARYAAARLGSAAAGDGAGGARRVAFADAPAAQAIITAAGAHGSMCVCEREREMNNHRRTTWWRFPESQSNVVSVRA
jgi:hypothetical protein